ncbi:MAG: TIR domain-containing protein [Sphingomonas sp.]|nr:TIR domain-containing protein [Sphingomonas sp.]RZV53093.1 MAG: TIR domain-containing protein [Sphingomonadaceae bacterium]
MIEDDRHDAAEKGAESVFISYSRENESAAQQIVHLLEAQGFDVWWDALIQGGNRFADLIEAKLDQSDRVVVLWSASAVRSEWVTDEATKGRDAGKLIPVTLDGTQPPMGFRQHQLIDASNSDFAAEDPAMQALIKALWAEGVSEWVGELPPGQTRVSRRTLLVGGGVATALAASGGFIAFGDRIFGPGLSDRSIAVLPFSNLNENSEQAYFSTGLAEELRTRLGLHPDILVAAQTSSETVAELQLDAQQIASRLKVANVLEGSVRRGDGLVRVALRLVGGRDGFERWSDSLDRPFDALLDLQQDIANLVADQLAVQLAAPSAGDATGGTRSAQALDAYLEGAELYRQAVDEGTDRRALALYDLALEIDPEYAAAHAARARVLTVIASNYSRGEELAPLYAEALVAARRSVEVAPQFSTGHSALGFVLANGMLDIRGARAAYLESYRTGFGNADILSGFANFGARTGDLEEARDAVFRAKQLDPLNSQHWRNAALIEMNAGDFAAAREQCRQALAMNDDARSVMGFLGTMALLEGAVEAAREYFEKEPSGLTRNRGLAIVAAREGNDEESALYRQNLEREYGDNALYQLAQIDAQIGAPEAALDKLERAYDAGDSGLVQSYLDPLLEPIRSQERYQALMEKLGFEA